ncbi:MAG: hypothetical protein KDC38_01100 [Planctomycetes bacterium]|nr:hypothetical protein [Planctomycetota bacterium]
MISALVAVSSLCVHVPLHAQVPVQSNAEVLFASDGDPSDRFGDALAVDGDIAVVGAPGDDDMASGAGAAYIFRRIGGDWVEEQKLVASDGGFDDRFGDVVAIHGDVVAVSATNNSSPRFVYLFRFDGSTWLEEQKLASSGAGYGRALALHEDTLVVGDSLHDFTTGAAYVYEWSGTAWDQVQLLSPPDADLFGIDVDLDADTLVVGASGQSPGGAAYVYTRTGSSFSLQEVLTASDAAPFWGFGATVSLQDDFMFVTAIGAEGDAGAVYVLHDDGSTWTEVQKLSSSVPPPAGGFGLVIDVEGPYMAIGSYGGIGCDAATQTYLFAKIGPAWVEARKLIAPPSEPLNSMSRTIAVTNDQVWVGAQCVGPGTTGPGGAYVYELEAAFSRGDCNVDELIDCADAIRILMTLFELADPLPCQDACDANDDGAVNIADPIVLLTHLFSGGGPLPSPTGGCGDDPTIDTLVCDPAPYCP